MDRGLANERLPVVVTVADYGLTVGRDVPPADVSADACFAYNVLGLWFRDGRTGGQTGKGSGQGANGQDSCDAMHS